MNPAVQGISLTLLTGLVWGGVGISLSRIVKTNMDFPSFMFLASGLILAFSLAVMPDYGKIYSGDANYRLFELLLVMLAVAATSNLGFLKMRNAMQLGHHGFAWAVSQSAMILPFIFAFLFWNEKMGVSRFAGAALILASLLLFSLRQIGSQRDTSDLNSGTQAGGAEWIALSISAFLLIGISQIFSILPSHWSGWSDKGVLRVPLFSLFTFIFWTGYFFSKGSKVSFKATFIFSLLYALLVLSGQITLYKSLDLMESVKMSSIVYPLAVGTCIMMVVVYSALALKEKFGVAGILGVSMGLLGIILISI